MEKLGILMVPIIGIMMVACRHNYFYELPNQESYFQFCKNDGKLLRITNTDGDGAQKIAMFSNQGDLIDELTVDNIPFSVKRWKNDTINLVFYLSGDSSSVNKVKGSLRKFSGQTLIYEAVRIKSSATHYEKRIDSVRISADNLAQMMLAGVVTRELPIDSVTVYPEYFSVIQFENGSAVVMDYIPKDKEMPKRYMKKLIE